MYKKELNQTSASASHKNGALAEQLARKIVTNSNCQIISTNYNCRFGEIDIIALDKKHVVFTEVRHRSYSQWGSAIQSINNSKQSKIIKTAEYFLAKNPHLKSSDVRFDVICFENNLDIDLATWVQHAFMIDQ